MSKIKPLTGTHSDILWIGDEGETARVAVQTSEASVILCVGDLRGPGQKTVILSKDDWRESVEFVNRKVARPTEQPAEKLREIPAKPKRKRAKK